MGSASSSLPVAEGVNTLPDRVVQTAELAGDSDRQSSASAGSLLPSDAHGSGRASQRWRSVQGVAPLPPTRLAVLRQSLATPITQLWPWGLGPQAGPDSAATCPAHLSGDGWDGRQLALAHTELFKVRTLCESNLPGADVGSG